MGGLAADLTADLTAEQEAVVVDGSHRVRVLGAAGTGKSTVLGARFQALATHHRPSAVLVLCRDRGAAERFRDRLLPRLAGAFDSLPVTTPAGLALDLVARHGSGPPPRLLAGGPQRALVRRLLAADDPGAWPRFGAYLGRSAFAAALAAELASSGPGGRPDPGWPPELTRFHRRYRAALVAEGAVDLPGLLERAADLAPAAAGRFAHVLVDDHEAASAAQHALVCALTEGGAAALTVAGNPAGASGRERGGDPGHLLALAVDAEHHLTAAFRQPPPPELVLVAHPANEAEAAVAELVAARRSGVAWTAMAVLAPRPGPRVVAVGRALDRHGVPWQSGSIPPAALPADPLPAAVLDTLRWAAGDDRAFERLLASPLSGLGPAALRALRHDAAARGTAPHEQPGAHRLVALRDHVRRREAAGDPPADLAYEVWARGLAAPGGAQAGSDPPRRADRGLDALVALIDGLRAHEEAVPRASLAETLAALDEGEAEPAWWRTGATSTGEGVTLTTVAGAAGREWHTVVLVGCVEGELPRLGGRRRLGRPSGPADRARALAEERCRFGVATSRATGRTVAVAAPEPGVLVSRYVEGWAHRAPSPLPAPGPPPPARPPTAGTGPLWPGGALELSATQLETYGDCPLRYAYEYVLRARGEPGVHAGLGSLVHQVLAEFAAPGSDRPRTREALLALGAERWRDDLARYRPQVEEARRDFYAMLESWWEAEGDPAGPGRPDVVAVEHRFSVAVGPHRLSGAIDRVDRVSAGAAPGLRVVDYKTGKREPSAAEVGDDLQLNLYHLAANRDPALAAHGPTVAMRLLYLRSMRTFDVDAPDVAGRAAATEARVLAAAADLLAERFEPSVDATCRHCDFHRLCPLQPEGRHVEPAG